LSNEEFDQILVKLEKDLKALEETFNVVKT